MGRSAMGLGEDPRRLKLSYLCGNDVVVASQEELAVENILRFGWGEYACNGISMMGLGCCYAKGGRLARFSF